VTHVHIHQMYMRLLPHIRPLPITSDPPRSSTAPPFWPRPASFLPLSQPPRGPKLTKEPQRTKLGAMGEYYRAFVVTEEPVTKWPAKRDEVEYDVLRVSVNMRTN